MYEFKNRYQYQSTEKKNVGGKVLLIVALVLVAGIGGFFLVRGLVNRTQTVENETESERMSLAELWNSGLYEDLLARCEQVLQTDPMNADALLFRGFASFYASNPVSLSEEYSLSETSVQYLDEAVFSLRRAMIANPRYLRGEADYVLGKAYYHKGRFYSELAIRYLTESVEEGFVGDDTHVYLGLAYALQEDYDRSVGSFLVALERDPGDSLLLYVIGNSYYQLSRYDDARGYLESAVRDSSDANVRERSLLLLGEISTQEGDLAAAVEFYTEVLELDTRSADAHYFLGNVYEQLDGNRARARSEWRAALRINPNHRGALFQLYQ